MKRGTALLIIFSAAISGILAQNSPMEYMGAAFLQPKNEEAQGNIRALIIGISNYRELPKDAQLQFAHTDAINFYNFLRSKAGGNVDSTSIKLLLNNEATAAEIYAGLDWLLDCQRNDRVIVFFAGHGDMERKTIRQRGFLLAHDAPRAGYQAGGAVTVMDLRDYLETLAVQNKANVLLITDACRAGNLAGGDEGNAQTTAALQEQWSSIAKILSSQSGEKSFESKDWGNGHGVFTYHLLDGLKGMADKNNDGFVTLSEINLYLSHEVPVATENKQNPMVAGSLQIKISQIDKMELASLKLRKSLQQSEPATMLANRSSSVIDSISEPSQRLYRQFRDALGQNKLITPEGNSAFDIYHKLKSDNPGKKEFIGDLRRSLLSSLEASAQKVINKYMVNDKTLNEEQINYAAREIDASLQLMTPRDIRWKTMQARHLFLDNGFLQCICNEGKTGETEAAMALSKLRESLRLEPDAGYVYNSMGNVHYSRNNLDSAKYFYLMAHDLAPNWSNPISSLGTVYAALNDSRQALEYYNKALRLIAKSAEADTTNAENYLGLGFALYQNSKYPEAINELRKGLGIQKKNSSVLNAEAGYRLANAYLQLSLPAKALEALEEFKIINITSELEFLQARIYASMGNYSEAMNYFNAAVSMGGNPKSAEFLDASVWCLKSKDFAQAKELAEKSLRKVSRSSQEYQKGHYQLACIYSVQEMKANALNELSMAIQAGYSDYQVLQFDEPLKFIRSFPEFDKLVSKIKK